MSGLSHAVRLARIDVTRMVRKHTDRSGGLGRIVSTVISVLLFAAATVGGGYLAQRLGSSLATGELASANAMAVARGVVAVAGLIFAVVLLVRAVGQRGTLTNAEGLLTIVPTHQALLGVLLAEYVYVLLWLGGPAVGVGVGLAAGTGTVWPALTVPLGVAVMAVSVVAVGYPLGLGVRHLVTRFAFVVRHKVALIALVFVVYFAMVVTGSLNTIVVALFEPMQLSPTGWFADLLLLGVPSAGAAPLWAAGSVGVALALGVVGTAVGGYLADLHWFSDPVLAGEPEPEPSTSTSTTRSALERRLNSVLDTATAALVVLAWRRARRAPMKLLYAAYPLFFAVGMVADILQTGEVPSYLPLLALLFVTWAAGVIFTLNPLGDQGTVLPTTLLSRVDGTRFVRAHLFASLAVAVPLGTALTAGATLISPVDATTAIVLVVAAPVLMLVASALSVGIGVAFPRFRAVTVTRSVKAVVPSLVAFALFTLHLIVTALSAAVVYDESVRSVATVLLNWLLPSGLAVNPETLLTVAAVLLLVLAVLPVASYRYAVRRFDGYTLE